VGHVTISLPDDVKQISWAAEQLGIGTSTAYRLVAAGKIPGAFKVGAQWRISVPGSWLRSTGSRPPRTTLRCLAQPGSARVFPSASARSRSRPSRTWEYTRRVIEESRWPNRPATVVGRSRRRWPGWREVPEGVEMGVDPRLDRHLLGDLDTKSGCIGSARPGSERNMNRQVGPRA